MVWNFIKQIKAIRSRTGMGMAAIKRSFFKNRCDIKKAVIELNKSHYVYD